MCIRDSVIDVFRAFTVAPHAVAAGASRVLPVGAIEDALASVSYTHLRAHETVLDIVCRLLLDKKNPPHCTTIDREPTRDKPNNTATSVSTSDTDNPMKNV